MSWPLSVFLVAILALSGECHYDDPCHLPDDPSIQGRCVPVEQCQETLTNLQNLLFHPDFSYRDYLEARVCDHGIDGSIHICCADESREARHSHCTKKHRSRRSCLSFRYKQGTCMPIEMCPSIYNCSMELQRSYNPTLHLHLTQSLCYEENGKVFVCCDDNVKAPLKFSKRFVWRECETPFLDSGKCVPPSRCGLVKDSKNIPEEYKAFKVGCDQLKDVSYMCCPTDEVQYDTKLGKECNTVNGRPGICVESDRCDDAINANDSEEYVRKNWCYTSLEQVEYVCCGLKKVLKSEYGGKHKCYLDISVETLHYNPN